MRGDDRRHSANSCRSGTRARACRISLCVKESVGDCISLPGPVFAVKMTISRASPRNIINSLSTSSSPPSHSRSELRLARQNPLFTRFVLPILPDTWLDLDDPAGSVSPDWSISGSKNWWGARIVKSPGRPGPSGGAVGMPSTHLLHGEKRAIRDEARSLLLEVVQGVPSEAGRTRPHIDQDSRGPFESR